MEVVHRYTFVFISILIGRHGGSMFHGGKLFANGIVFSQYQIKHEKKIKKINASVYSTDAGLLRIISTHTF